MSVKVVINVDYGGFGISLEAARFMAARGNEMATAEIRGYEDEMAGAKDPKEVRFYGYGPKEGEYRRDDPDLVAAVETLGGAANGEAATLRVVEVPHGKTWLINNFNGKELCIAGKELCILP